MEGEDEKERLREVEKDRNCGWAGAGGHQQNGEQVSIVRFPQNVIYIIPRVRQKTKFLFFC